MWREWIEIFGSFSVKLLRYASPSVWREWIEMNCISQLQASTWVSLRVEGVD